MKKFAFAKRTLALAAVFALALGLAGSALAFDEITDGQAMVRVSVKPTQLAPGQAAKFRVRLNTHSVDLSQDLTKVSTLTDDKGNKLAPTKWDGSGPGGHHRNGTLSFPALAKDAGAVTLVIQGIGGAKRVYKWSLR